MAQKDGPLFPARGARSDPAPGPGAPRFVQQEAEIILSLLFIKVEPIIRRPAPFVKLRNERLPKFAHHERGRYTGVPPSCFMAVRSLHDNT